MFEETVKEGKIFRREEVVKKRCYLQLTVYGAEGSHSEYGDCDEENCIFQKALRK